MRLWLMLVIAAFAQSEAPQTVSVSGVIPPGLRAPSYVTWIAADGSQHDVGCALDTPGTWRCERVAGGARGLVVIVGVNGEVAALPAGSGGAAGSSVSGAWGRVVRLTAGGVASDDLHDIRASVWKPERPVTRALTRRFSPIPETGVALVPFAPAAVWVTGGSVDADAFLRFDGPAIATVRVALSLLTNGPPDVPVFAMAEAPSSLGGQVIDSHGQGVERVAVDLWEPLPSEPDQDPDHVAVWIRRATALTDAQGAFSFDRVAGSGYELAAMDGARGRATAIVKSVAEFVVLRLEPPTSATGRVLRRGLPVSSARIRFVPDALALSTSSDPTVHLSEETSTGDDGQFVLRLPLSRKGVVQVLTQDGSSVRVGLPAGPNLREMRLGDIVVPDTRHVTLRLLDPRQCELVAVGPMGEVGLTIVRAQPNPSNVYWIELPEPGTWILNVRCDDREYAVDPPTITIASDGPEDTVDVRIRG